MSGRPTNGRGRVAFGGRGAPDGAGLRVYDAEGGQAQVLNEAARRAGHYTLVPLVGAPGRARLLTACGGLDKKGTPHQDLARGCFGNP